MSGGSVAQVNVGAGNFVGDSYVARETMRSKGTMTAERGLYTNTISEFTTGAGVTVAGVLIKNGVVFGSAIPLSSAQPITVAGNYILANDILGSFPILVPGVTLNLGGFTIDANGAASGVSCVGQSDVSVFNGTIVGSVSAALDLDGCSNVQVSNLNFRNNSAISLYIHNCNAVRVSGIDVTDGNRALCFHSCTQLSVCDSYAYSNTNDFEYPSPGPATFFLPNNVVEFYLCNDVSVQGVWANNNVKAVPTQGAATSLQPNVGVFLVFGCNRVYLLGCKTNGNTSAKGMRGLYVFGAIFLLPFPLPATTGVIIENHQSNNNVGNFANLPGSLSGIGIFGAPGTQVLNCQTNGNIGNDQLPGTAPFTQQFTTGMSILGSTSVKISGHQANYNVSRGSESLSVIIGDRSDDIVVENSEMSYNGDPLLSTVASGIDLSIGFSQTPSNGATIRNVTCSHNKANIFTAGIISWHNNAVFDHCDTNYNQSTGGLPSPANNILIAPAFGLGTMGQNCRVTNCTSNGNNSVNSDAEGFSTHGYTPINPPSIFPVGNNTVFEDCLATRNVSTNLTGKGFAFGLLTDPTLSSANCVAKNCIAIANEVGFSQNATTLNTFVGNTVELASGTAYENVPQGPTSNVVTLTQSTGAFSGPGVVPPTSWSNINIV